MSKYNTTTTATRSNVDTGTAAKKKSVIDYATPAGVKRLISEDRPHRKILSAGKMSDIKALAFEAVRDICALTAIVGKDGKPTGAYVCDPNGSRDVVWSDFKAKRTSESRALGQASRKLQEWETAHIASGGKPGKYLSKGYDS